MHSSNQKKQVVVLYASTLIGSVVGILNSVLNTNSLVPEQFGDVRYVQNIIAFVSSLLLVGFFVSGSRLLATSKSKTQSRRLRGGMLVILAMTVLVVMLTMIAMYAYTELRNPHSQMLGLYLCAIPFCGTTLMLNYVNTVAQGDNHIGRIAIARLLPSVLYFVIAFFVYKYYGATPVRMLLLYNGISFIVLLIVIISTKPSFINLTESFAVLNEENKHYGLNVYIGSLASVSTGYIAGITLGMFCEDNSNVGYYTLAQNMATPLAMLPSIIGTTYFKSFASENKIRQSVMITSVGLTVTSGLLFIFLIEYVVIFLYDDTYSCVAEYASWLVVGTCMYGLGDMFNRFLGAHGQGRQIRNAAFACGAVLSIGSVVLVFYFHIYGAIATRILSALVYFYVIYHYYRCFILTK